MGDNNNNDDTGNGIDTDNSDEEVDTVANYNDDFDPELESDSGEEGARSEPGGASEGTGGGQGLRWCVACQAEYLSSVETCPVCDAPLQDGRPTAVEDVAGADEDKLAYEFHEWSVESRVMMESLLVSAGVVHAWQGTTLMVREEDEDAVDAVVDEVEAATLPTLDPEADLVLFETSDWTGEHQSIVISRLVSDEIPHAFDPDGDLVVEQADQERVSGLIEGVQSGAVQADDGADAGAALLGLGGVGGEGDGEEEPVYEFGEVRLQGLEAQELMGEIFVAANRLSKNPRHPKSVEAAIDRADEIKAAALPFGFERPVWASIVEGSVALKETILDDDAEEEDLMESARELCQTLRPYV